VYIEPAFELRNVVPVLVQMPCLVRAEKDQQQQQQQPAKVQVQMLGRCPCQPVEVLVVDEGAEWQGAAQGGMRLKEGMRLEEEMQLEAKW
jgi:hypothetical protein